MVMDVFLKLFSFSSLLLFSVFLLSLSLSALAVGAQEGGADYCPDTSIDISYGTEDMVYSQKQEKLVDPPSQGNERACTQDNKDVAFEGCKKVFDHYSEEDIFNLDERCNQKCRSQSEGRCGGSYSGFTSVRLIEESCEKYYDYSKGEALYSFECVAHVECNCKDVKTASRVGVPEFSILSILVGLVLALTALFFVRR